MARSDKISIGIAMIVVPLIGILAVSSSSWARFFEGLIVIGGAGSIIVGASILAWELLN